MKDPYMQVAKISDRLNEAMNRKGYKQVDLSKETGISTGMISSYLSGKFEPKNTAISKLATVLDVSPTWLAGFDVPMERESSSIFKPSSWEFSIPFISQKLSAGPGADWISDDELEVKTINLAADLPKGVDSSSLVCAEVSGDSMEGAHLYSGDIVIFSKGFISGDGIYVLSLCGDVLVKRVQYAPWENKIYIISENPKYPIQAIEADNENITILGKVLKWFHFEH